jgi:hypothetical protein
LILWILNKCHKIGLTKELSERYLQKSQSFKNIITIKIWKDILSRSDKQRWCDSHLKDIPSNIEHDRHVIEPAIYLKGILVTTDEKLRERLPKWAENKGYKIVIKSPEDVLREENES